MKILNVVRRFTIALSLLLQLSVLCLHSHAAPGDVDLSFDPGSGLNGGVSAAVLQADGKLLIGGAFTTVKGLARNRVARLNSDGSGDPSFTMDLPTETVPSVFALALQPDGKVLVGHDYGVTRLNSDGSLDAAFSAVVTKIYEDGGVYSIVLQTDGKALVGGSFSAVNGTSRNGIARLNPDGTVDASFSPNSAVMCCVYSLALQPDGKALVMGVMNGGDGFTVARLNGDGTLDDTFKADPVVGSLSHMSLQADGKVLVGGYLNSSGYGIARLNENGSLDGSFNPDLPPYEGTPYIQTLHAQPDGGVLISGSFKTVDGTKREGIARLQADGSLDTSFDFGAGTRSGAVLALQPNGQVIIGGYDRTPDGMNRTHMARLNTNGSLDSSFHPGAAMDERVNTVLALPEGKVLIAGSFRSVRGSPRPGIARLHADGGLDTAFTPETALIGYASHIRSVAMQADGKALITGNFSTQHENGTQYGRSIARLHPDGALDRTFEPDLTVFIPDEECPANYSCQPVFEASDVLAQPDGKAIISGYAGRIITGEEVWVSSTVHFVARFHADGSLDESFNLGAEISAAGLAVMKLQPDGKLLVAGGLIVNGENRGIVRFEADGSVDSTFQPEVNIGAASLTSMALQPDGKVLIGGYRWLTGPQGKMPVLRLNADGSVDSGFTPPAGANDTVQSIALQRDGKIVVTGLLYSINSSNYNTVARLNADGTVDPAFIPPTVDHYIMTIALQNDGNVLIGGDFSIINGVARPKVARLYGDSPSPLWPDISIARSEGFITISWPSSATNFLLYESANILAPGSWTRVAQAPVTNDGQISVTIPTEDGSKFFLVKSE